MRIFLALLAIFVLPNAWAGCTGTTGTLALTVTQPRASCVSPCLLFFDATATTDSATLGGQNNVYQDVAYTWNFGDPSAISGGTTKWGFGANGQPFKNRATGFIAAHLYVVADGAGDQNYIVNAQAYDGTTTAGNPTVAACSLIVTVFDPAGANGFPGTATICVAASSTPVAGSGGCPAGASVSQNASWSSALNAIAGGMSGKRILFRCGDTFSGTVSGNGIVVNGVKWSIGAYGTCVGTQTGRPIFSNSTSGADYISINTATANTGDGRISDIDFEGSGGANLAVNAVQGTTVVPYQITLWNLLSNGNATSYAWSQGAQWGVIGSVQTGATGIGVFVNYNENNPPYAGNVFNNLDYQAVIGNSFTGPGCCGTGAGVETIRISACRLCVIENNLSQNSNNVGAVLKLHEGNTHNSCGTQSSCAPPCTVGATFATASCWVGIYTELVEISDNVFMGNSGSNLTENCPQNGGADERMRYIVFERNYLNGGGTSSQGGKMLLLTAINETVRNNVFYMPGTTLLYSQWGVEATGRGAANITPTGLEIYNNTCYAPNGIGGQVCIAFDNATQSPGVAATNSIAKNNLFYITATGHIAVGNTGVANTVSNNSATPSNNPSFKNGSGNFSLYGDFLPQANATGADATVPNWFDGFGFAWAGAMQLGALSPVSP